MLVYITVLVYSESSSVFFCLTKNIVNLLNGNFISRFENLFGYIFLVLFSDFLAFFSQDFSGLFLEKVSKKILEIFSERQVIRVKIAIIFYSG